MHLSYLCWPVLIDAILDIFSRIERRGGLYRNQFFCIFVANLLVDGTFFRLGSLRLLPRGRFPCYSFASCRHGGRGETHWKQVLSYAVMSVFVLLKFFASKGRAPGEPSA